MNIAVVKLLSRRGPRLLRLSVQNVIRRKSTEEPCPPGETTPKPPKEEPCPKPPKEDPCPKPPKEDPCPKPSKEDPTQKPPKEDPCPKPPKEDPCPKPGKTEEPGTKPNDPSPAKPEEKEPCPPSTKAKNPCPPTPIKTKEPCPPKKPDLGLAPVSRKFTCPEPPPCPPVPTGSPVICPKIVDNNNPCNYVPPECPDIDSPNLTRLKKLQCLFQEDNGIPLYLKKGKTDAFLYQTAIVLVIISFGSSIYSVFDFLTK